MAKQEAQEDLKLMRVQNNHSSSSNMTTPGTPTSPINKPDPKPSPGSLMAEEALAFMAKATGGSFDATTKEESSGGSGSNNSDGNVVRNLNTSHEFNKSAQQPTRKSSVSVVTPNDTQRKYSDESSLSNTNQPQNEWMEETEIHPLPPFGIQSPVISYLLESWTSDASKLKYVTLWLSVLCNDINKIPPTFPLGLQLVALKPEIKDGILTLVIPILRNKHPSCLVHSRMERFVFFCFYFFFAFLLFLFSILYF